MSRLGPDLREPEEELALLVVTLDDFAAVHEPGAEALLGTPEQVLLPVGGDAMIYGDGGTGKTTLAVDLAFHVAVGAEWLGIATRPARVLLIENEGPRVKFRQKLARKLETWQGEPWAPNVHVLEIPWGQFTFANDQHRRREASKGVVRPVRNRDVGAVQLLHRRGDAVALSP